MPENTFRGEVTFLNLQKVIAFNPRMHCFKLLQMFLRVKYHLIPLERILFHLDLWKVLICRDFGGTLVSKSFLKHCFPGKAQLMTFSLRSCVSSSVDTATEIVLQLPGESRSLEQNTVLSKESGVCLCEWTAQIMALLLFILKSHLYSFPQHILKHYFSTY